MDLGGAVNQGCEFGWSRRGADNPKHKLRVLLAREYGAGLEFRGGPAGAQRRNDLICDGEPRRGRFTYKNADYPRIDGANYRRPSAITQSGTSTILPNGHYWACIDRWARGARDAAEMSGG